MTDAIEKGWRQFLFSANRTTLPTQLTNLQK
jgi:hypothetical protein